jgi:hypothetical protein
MSTRLRRVSSEIHHITAVANEPKQHIAFNPRSLTCG